MRTASRGRCVVYKQQATSHRLHAALSDSPDEAALAAEIRGPCRVNRQDDMAAAPWSSCLPLGGGGRRPEGGCLGHYAVRNAQWVGQTVNRQRTKRSCNAHNPLPTLPQGREKSRLQAAGHDPRATGYLPLSKPPPRRGDLLRHKLRATGHPPITITITTYHALRTTNPWGGHTGPPLRCTMNYPTKWWTRGPAPTWCANCWWRRSG